MGITAAQENARNLLHNLSIEDNSMQLRKACAEIGLSVSVMNKARRAAATTNKDALRNVAASLVDHGVSTEMACRISGISALDLDAPNRRREAAAADEPGHSNAARSTPATAHDDGSEGA